MCFRNKVKIMIMTRALHPTSGLGGLARIAAVIAILFAWSNQANAQYENKALAVGSLHHMYNEVGSETEYWWGPYGYEWPAQYRWRGTLRANQLWIAVDQWKNPDGETVDKKIVHIGPRATGQGEFFPQQFETVSQFEPPEIVVDELPSYNKLPDNDRVDPSMKYDRMIIDKAHTLTGVTLTRRIGAFSQEDHQNYHIQEYILTNTGNIDDDEEVEIEQTQSGIYLHLANRYGYGNFYVPGQEWGANVMNDVVGDGLEDYGTDLRARYTWLGNSPGHDMDPLGAPINHDNHWFTQEGDSARLVQQQFVGNATLHAPAEAGGPDADNVNSTDPSQLQPSVTGYIGADHSLLSANDPYDIPKMQREFKMLSGGWASENNGHMYPHHADAIDQDGDFTTPEGSPRMEEPGGQQSFHSYGPYTLEPGESIRIVEVTAVDGLDRQEAVAVGKGFVANGLDPHAPITLERKDGAVALGKNTWVMTGKDSLFSTFERAELVFDEVIEGNKDLPRPPKPPKRFEVTSGVDKINLTWETFGEAPLLDHFEVYRTKNHWEGIPQNNFLYEKIATVPAEAGKASYTFADKDVTRGINYYYYIQSVGRPSDNDESLMTRPGALRSNRHYTQTYTAASLKRPPGETLSDASIVPNPYVISAEDNVAWPDRDRLAFLDIPGKCTIKVYTEMGELVKTIEHTDGSGDEFWKLETEDRQMIVSGVYIAVIEDLETGKVEYEKFSVIR